MGWKMKRREFIFVVSSAIAVWPFAVQAQQVASPRHIGFLLVGLSPKSKPAQHFRQGMRDAAYTEDAT
jgi:hypothetical protein